MTALRAHRETHLLERAFAGPAYEDRDLVFANPLGAPIYPMQPTKWFAGHRKDAEIQAAALARAT